MGNKIGAQCTPGCHLILPYPQMYKLMGESITRDSAINVGNHQVQACLPQGFVQNSAFLKALSTCLQACVQQDRLQDPAFQRRATANFRPFSWLHLIAPVVALVREGMERFVTSRYDADLQALAHAAQAATASKIPGLEASRDADSRCCG